MTFRKASIQYVVFSCIYHLIRVYFLYRTIAFYIFCRYWNILDVWYIVDSFCVTLHLNVGYLEGFFVWGWGGHLPSESAPASGTVNVSMAVKCKLWRFSRLPNFSER